MSSPGSDEDVAPTPEEIEKGAHITEGDEDVVPTPEKVVKGTNIAKGGDTNVESSTEETDGDEGEG